MNFVVVAVDTLVETILTYLFLISIWVNMFKFVQILDFFFFFKIQ